MVDDDFAVVDGAVMRRRNNDLEGFGKVQGKSRDWQGVYSRRMNRRRMLATEPNAFAGVRPRLPRSFQGTPCIALGNIDPGPPDAVPDQGPKRRFATGDMLSYWIERKPRDLAAAIRQWDSILINDQKAR